MSRAVMVTMAFDPGRRAEIVAHVPAEQARIRDLRAQGAVDALYISLRRGTASGWSCGARRWMPSATSWRPCRYTRTPRSIWLPWRNRPNNAAGASA